MKHLLKKIAFIFFLIIANKSTAQLTNIGAPNVNSQRSLGAVAEGNNIYTLEWTSPLKLYKHNGTVWNLEFTLPNNITPLNTFSNSPMCFYNNELYFLAIEKITYAGSERWKDTVIPTLFKYNGINLTRCGRLIGFDPGSYGSTNYYNAVYMTDMKVFNNELYVAAQGIRGVDLKWSDPQKCGLTFLNPNVNCIKFNGTSWQSVVNNQSPMSLLNSKGCLKMVSSNITTAGINTIPTSEYFISGSGPIQYFYGHPDSNSYYSMTYSNAGGIVNYCNSGQNATTIMNLPESKGQQIIQFGYSDSAVHFLALDYSVSQSNGRIITLKGRKSYEWRLPFYLKFNAPVSPETQYIRPVIISLRNSNKIVFNAINTITGLTEFYMFDGEAYKTIPSIIGRAYVDQNVNNVYDAGDLAIPNKTVNLNGNITTTNNQGFYNYTSTDLISGSAFITIPAMPNKTIVKPTPGYYNHPISIDSINMRRDFIYTYNTNYNDLQVNIQGCRGTRVRSAIAQLYYVTIKNNSGVTKSGLVTVSNNSIFNNFSSTEPSYTNTAGVLSFSFNNMLPDETKVFTFYATLDNSIALNTVVNFTATIDPAALFGDVVTANNQSILNLTVTNSYDPNDKTSNKDGIVSPGLSEIIYHINFQNTGNDTAYNVVLIDTLSSNLNAESISIISNSHPMNLRFENNILKFEFYGINLVDSNTNEPKSHGFATYKINAKPNLPNGTVIKNKASIYFDFNQPIITNYSIIQIKDPANKIQDIYSNNTLKIVPNPANNLIKLTTNSVIKSIKIVDLNGAELIKQTNNFNAIDISTFKNGFYIVVVETVEGVLTSKLLKN